MNFRPFALSIALAAVLLPQTASALSCMRPDIVHSYHRAAESEKNYVVFNGAFEFDESLNPVNSMTQEPNSLEAFEARFVGTSMTLEGFTHMRDVTVTMQPDCLSVWCGHITPDIPILAFVEVQNGEYVVNEGPCPSFLFYEPDQSDLDQVLACFRGEDCLEMQF